MRIGKCCVWFGILTLFSFSSGAWAEPRGAAPKATGGEPAATQIRPSKVVVETFAHKPAPLKEGNNVDIFITFKNKGLGKSPSTAKFKITCLVLSGGGPSKTCAVASTERSFGKEILPGATHSVSLLGATPAMGGEYRVSVIVVGQEGRPFSKILKVAPKIILKKAPDMGAVKKQ